jgi:hypothetical protein
VKRSEIEQLKERLRQHLKEKFMDLKVKKYTVADVYTEANLMLKTEMEAMKNRPLNSSEEIKMKELSRLMSKLVLKELKVI